MDAFPKTCARAAAAIGLALCHAAVLSAPYQECPAGAIPAGNPFVGPGTWTVDTSAATPILSGPIIVVGTVTPENVAAFCFTGVSIPAGVTIRATGTRPLALISTGSFDMTGGTIDASGTFVGGVGYVSGAGAVASGPGVGGTAISPAGSGGGGFSTSGGAGGTSGGAAGGPGGATYGNLAQQLTGGSRGGGTSGGAAGGAIELGAATTMTIGGTVNVNGYPGADLDGQAGGGSSGGGILLHAQTVTVSGSLQASGGRGGNGGSGGGGGGGAPGRIHVLTSSGSMTIAPGAQISLNGGAGGTGSAPGQVATSSLPQVGTLPAISQVKVSGCVNLGGTPLAGATVKLKQRGTQASTTTDTQGCYAFTEGVTNRTGTLTIELPSLP